MKNTNRMAFAVAFTLLLLLNSCKWENEDTLNTVPLEKIKPIGVLNSPSSDITLASGDNFTITGEISDNEALEKYIVNIVCLNKPQINPPIPFFNWDTTVYVTGATASFEHTITVPVNVASGFYTLFIEVDDKAGNMDTLSQRKITIKNSQDSLIPDLASTYTPYPNTNNTINLDGTSNIEYSFKAWDYQSGVNRIELKLLHFGSDSIYFYNELKLNGSGFDNKSGNIPFLSNWPKGDYQLTAILFDTKNNFVSSINKVSLK